MAYPKREKLTPSGQHVAREYERARTRGVTQKEFAQATGLGSARYLRKILAGERSGRILEERAAEGGAFNVPISYGGQIRSIEQVRLPSGTSKLDIYQPSVQRRIARAIKRKQRDERSKSKKPWGTLSQYEKAKLRGTPVIGEISTAKEIHRMPIAVLRNE